MSKRSGLLEAAATLERALEEFDPRVLAELEAEREEHHKQANAYASTAGVFRRRAAGALAAGEIERAAELERRAAYYEARAIVKGKAAGAPLRVTVEAPIMPRHLRTKAESLALVDELRRDLAELVERFGDMATDEVALFASSLLARAETRDEQHEIEQCWSIVIRYAVRLGVRFNPDGTLTFVGFRPPELAEPGENNNTPPTVVPSSHEVPTTPDGGDSR